MVPQGASQHLELCMAQDGWSVSRWEQITGQVGDQQCVSSGPPFQLPVGIFTALPPHPPNLSLNFFSRQVWHVRLPAIIVAASLLDRHQLFTWQWSRQMVSLGEERVHLVHRLDILGRKKKKRVRAVGQRGAERQTYLHRLIPHRPSPGFTNRRAACLRVPWQIACNTTQLWSFHLWFGK